MVDRQGELRAPRVLLVDDDIDILKALRAVLEDEGYEVLDAADANEALPLLRSNPPPDVILLDLMMPQMDGWALLQHMRENADVPKIPVVIMSAARGAGALIEPSLKFLKKPLDVATLLDAVREAASGPRP